MKTTKSITPILPVLRKLAKQLDDWKKTEKWEQNAFFFRASIDEPDCRKVKRWLARQARQVKQEK